MLIQLPTETWIEILDWLRRRDLIKKLDKLWDRQFTPLVQDWLHKYTRNVKLEELSMYQDDLAVHLGSGHCEEVPIAEVDMPGNITSFRIIDIDKLPLKPAMVPFLRLMRPLFRNICLDFNNDAGEDELPIPYQTTIRLLMPLIGDQIESLTLDHQCLQFFADHYPASVRFNAKLLSIGIYESGQSELLVNWLFTRRDDGQPRTLVFWWEQEQPLGDFCKHIRERFLDPSRQSASPFFVRWTAHFVTIPSAYENARTGEQLTIKEVEHTDGIFYGLMTNCPMGANGELFSQKTSEVLDWDHSHQQRCFYLGFD